MSDRLPITFTTSAGRQVEEAAQWWRANRTKAPQALREELERALELVAAHPEVGNSAKNSSLAGVRRVLLGRVRYHMYYRVVDHPVRSIQVLALWHSSRTGRPAL